MEEKPMFEDSLIESGNKLKTKRLMTSILSFIGQFALIGILILIPLIYTDALPKSMTMTFLVAPPPPPPPPPPAAPAPKVVKVIPRQFDAGRLMSPKAVPKEIAMIKEEELPPPSSGGVVGGVPGGVPGGTAGGVIGGIIGADPPAQAYLSPAGQAGAHLGGGTSERHHRQGWNDPESDGRGRTSPAGTG